MTRVENEHGSFDAPEGWFILEGLGATEETPDTRPEARKFVRSMVLTGDELPEGTEAEAYLEHQKTILEGALPRFALIDALVPTPASPGPCVLRYQFLPPDADAWLVQLQSYWFHARRVSLLTMTAHAEDVESSWAVFVQSAGAFVAPTAPEATSEPVTAA